MKKAVHKSKQSVLQSRTFEREAFCEHFSKSWENFLSSQKELEKMSEFNSLTKKQKSICIFFLVFLCRKILYKTRPKSQHKIIKNLENVFQAAADLSGAVLGY